LIGLGIVENLFEPRRIEAQPAHLCGKKLQQKRIHVLIEISNTRDWLPMPRPKARSHAVGDRHGEPLVPVSHAAKSRTPVFDPDILGISSVDDGGRDHVTGFPSLYL